jgi:hypothetical protein
MVIFLFDSFQSIHLKKFPPCLAAIFLLTFLVIGAVFPLVWQCGTVANLIRASKDHFNIIKRIGSSYRAMTLFYSWNEVAGIFR